MLQVLGSLPEAEPWQKSGKRNRVLIEKSLTRQSFVAFVAPRYKGITSEPQEQTEQAAASEQWTGAWLRKTEVKSRV